MAIASVNKIDATIQMRKGNEEDFDPSKMTAGEWAVSTDSKKVWMCFAPGIVLRMATYEAFEQDMIEIQTILATCQDIQVAAEAFEQLALQHKNAAAVSAANAKTSETNAKASETAAKNSQTAAKTSEDNTKASETNALASKNAASTSANTASTKASEAATSANNAENSANTATQKANDASTSATNAANSASTATQKANDATASAEEAEDYSKLSKSWAIGEGGMRPDESTNNSKYYAEQAERIVSAATSGALLPMGTIAFEELPTSAVSTGYMYNISNDFTSDSRFEDGGNLHYKAGANVYYTAGGKWDVLTGVQVTGVKGNSETNYRTGNVNLTKANIGLGNVPNVTTDNQMPTFTQASTRTNITSGEKLSVLFGKIMKYFSDLSETAFDGISTKWRTARNINGMSVDGSANRVNYGTCSTAAATAAKEVACTGFELAAGAEITVRFTITNTAANPTLNVNGTGAKPIYYRGTAIYAGYLAANHTYIFRYNGAQYDLVGDIDTNTTYNNMSAATENAAGKAGLVPAPGAGKQNGYLRGDGTWVTPTQNLLGTVPGIPLDQTMGKALKDDIDALYSNLTSMFKILTAIIPSTSIPGGSYKRIGLSYTVPDGYKVISAINFGVSGSSYANVFVFSSDSIIIGNVASGAITINGSVTLLLCKEGLM